MNSAIRWFLGIDDLRLSDPDTSLGWAIDLPGWAWLGAVLAAALLSWLTYRRLEGGTRHRAVLAGVRGLLLLLLLTLACGPRLEQSAERFEEDVVVFLADRSASMSVRDSQVGSGRVARDKELADTLDASREMLAGLSKEKRVAYLGFDSGVFDIASGADQPELGPPTGRRTLIGEALERTLRFAGGRPLSAIVLMSDGRSTDEVSQAVIRRLKAEQVAVHVVPFGREQPLADLEIEEVTAPALAFQKDTIPVRVRVASHGGVPGAEMPPGTVRLIDNATGAVLDERALSIQDGNDEHVVLTAATLSPGALDWRVEVTPGGEDLVSENNVMPVRVEVVDRPLNVLYVDGYSRWEQRYIRQMLLREATIRSSIMLIAPNRRYLVEGTEAHGGFPATQEQWAEYDAVVMGDVRPSMLTTEQMSQLREHVASRGGGMVWIAGPLYTPDGWRGTPLEDLLPMNLPAAGQGATGRWAGPVTMARAPAADQLGVLVTADDGDAWLDRLSDPRTGWSQLRWAQRISPSSLKPATEVLATAHPSDASGSPSGAEPIVMSMRYGAGRVLYVGTDEIWRWRYARGEALYERFWLPLLRMQGRESLARTANPALLRVSPRRPVVALPAQVEIALNDQMLVDEHARSVAVRITHANAPPGDQGVVLRLVPEDTGSDRLAALTYSASWVPDTPRNYTVECVEPALAHALSPLEVEVLDESAEMLEPAADYQALRRLAQETGGRVISPAEFGQLSRWLPNREVRVTLPPKVDTLWDSPGALILLVLFLTVEWVGRKLIRLI